MDGELEINTSELRELLGRLIDHLEASGSIVRLKTDYFWSISWDEAYDFSTTPSNLTVGQLSDIWADLNRYRDDIVAQNAVWLGDILRAIGHGASLGTVDP